MQIRLKVLFVLLIIVFKTSNCFAIIYETESIKVVKLDSNKTIINEFTNNQLEYIDSLINLHPIDCSIIESCYMFTFFIQLTNDTIQMLRRSDTEIDAELYNRLNNIKAHIDSYYSNQTGLIICLKYTPEKITFNDVDKGLWQFKSRNHKAEHLLHVLPFLDSSMKSDTIIPYLLNKRKYAVECSKGFTYIRKRKNTLFKSEGSLKYFKFISQDSCLFVVSRECSACEKLKNELLFVLQDQENVAITFRLILYDVNIEDLKIDKILFNQIADKNYQLRNSKNIIDYPKNNCLGYISSGERNCSIPRFWGNAFIEIQVDSKYVLLQPKIQHLDWRLNAIYNDFTNSYYIGWTKE